MNSNFFPIISIQRPIDFTRTNAEFDGRYESFIPKRLYLLEQNSNTGNALYILDCKSDPLLNIEKKSFLLSSIDGTIRNCPISNKEMSNLPLRITLPCLASDPLKFMSILPKKIESLPFGNLKDFKADLSLSSCLLPLIETLYEDKDNSLQFVSTFDFDLANCQAVFNRFGKLVDVFVKLKKETEYGSLVYFQKINDVFDEDIAKSVTNVIRQNIKGLFSYSPATGLIPLQLNDGRRFSVCPVKVNDSNMCNAFSNADIILANYGSTGFLDGMIYHDGPIQCFKDKKIIFDNQKKFSNVYQDSNDCSINPIPKQKVQKVKILHFPN